MFKTPLNLNHPPNAQFESREAGRGDIKRYYTVGVCVLCTKTKLHLQIFFPARGNKLKNNSKKEKDRFH